ncbi:GATA transcription factor 21 isoform X2 [Jatropha curcas]|uniref:GATA transcription factor 21 isoform X2 n=1 Tax=Jatropha curcas TaxID=180498 RepID=UPI0005FB6D32|nr:GATA transcription factor 21 isoform X2 [Jatropha curcas]
MTPVFLNSSSSNSFPLVELKEDQPQHDLQLFLSPHQASTTPTFFNAPTRDQEVNDKCISRGRRSSNDHHKYNTLSSPSLNENTRKANKLISCKREDNIIGDYYDGNGGGGGEGSSSITKWLPSKFQDQQCHAKSHNTNTTTIRVCSDCNTTTTPLWRSGPRGPKSLCNACGIRQRKARRAMAAAAMANGTVAATETLSSSSSSSTKTNYKLQYNKDKKLRTAGHVTQGKKLSKPPDPPHQTQRKLCLKNLALSLSNNSALQRIFPQDVQEAAILLMELSCGFIHS